MWSMDKIKPDTDALTKWMTTYKTTGLGACYVLSCKLDGISALYTTEDTDTGTGTGVERGVKRPTPYHAILTPAAKKRAVTSDAGSTTSAPTSQASADATSGIGAKKQAASSTASGAKKERGPSAPAPAPARPKEVVVVDLVDSDSDEEDGSDEEEGGGGERVQAWDGGKLGRALAAQDASGIEFTAMVSVGRGASSSKYVYTDDGGGEEEEDFAI